MRAVCRRGRSENVESAVHETDPIGHVKALGAELTGPIAHADTEVETSIESTVQLMGSRSDSFGALERKQQDTGSDL